MDHLIDWEDQENQNMLSPYLSLSIITSLMIPVVKLILNAKSH